MHTIFWYTFVHLNGCYCCKAAENMLFPEPRHRMFLVSRDRINLRAWTQDVSRAWTQDDSRVQTQDFQRLDIGWYIKSKVTSHPSSLAPHWQHKTLNQLTNRKNIQIKKDLFCGGFKKMFAHLPSILATH